VTAPGGHLPVPQQCCARVVGAAERSGDTLEEVTDRVRPITAESGSVIEHNLLQR
jgi:hypothetical protein